MAERYLDPRNYILFKRMKKLSAGLARRLGGQENFNLNISISNWHYESVRNYLQNSSVTNSIVISLPKAEGRRVPTPPFVEISNWLDYQDLGLSPQVWKLPSGPAP